MKDLLKEFVFDLKIKNYSHRIIETYNYYNIHFINYLDQLNTNIVKQESVENDKIIHDTYTKYSKRGIKTSRHIYLYESLNNVLYYRAFTNGTEEFGNPYTLTRSAKKDFEAIQYEYNEIWKLQDDNVGEATGVLTNEKEKNILSNISIW